MSRLVNFLKDYQNRIWIIFFLAAFSALGSGYLWYEYMNGTSLTCSLNGCNIVLNSDYSKFLGFPLAGLGFFYYFFLVLAIEIHFIFDHKLTQILFISTVLIGLFVVIYLRYLEFFVIHSICEQCWFFSFIPTVLMAVILIKDLRVPSFNFLQNHLEKGKSL